MGPSRGPSPKGYVVGEAITGKFAGDIDRFMDCIIVGETRVERLADVAAFVALMKPTEN